VARYGVRRILLASLGFTSIATADPLPVEDVPVFALEGPFATRDEACAAALGSRGTCATYHAVVTLAATRDWDAVEIGAVGDTHRANTKTRHFGMFVSVGKKWFANFLGTDGTIDTEFFPPCKSDGGVGSCAPFHRDKPSFYKPPKLSFVDAVKGGAREILLFYPTPADVGFRESAPLGELVQVCGIGAGAPGCTSQVVAVTRSLARMKSPADLFTGTDEMTSYSEDGKYQPYAGHLKF
jgi:hypothetical protein